MGVVDCWWGPTTYVFLMFHAFLIIITNFLEQLRATAVYYLSEWMNSMRYIVSSWLAYVTSLLLMPRVNHLYHLLQTPLNNNIRELFNLMNFLDADNWQDLQALEKEHEVLTEELLLKLHEVSSRAAEDASVIDFAFHVFLATKALFLEAN